MNYNPEGLRIAYEPKRKRFVLQRAEPRVELTRRLFDNLVDGQIIQLRGPAVNDRPRGRWWDGATITVSCHAGVHGGQVVYRIAGESFARLTYLLEWPD